MESIYVFLIRNDVWIYILSGMGLFWFGSELIRAQRGLRYALFGLERERGQRIRNSSLAFALFFTAVASLVFYVNAQIAPNLPAEALMPPTPTPDIFRTPLSSPTPLEGMEPTAAPSPTSPPVPTITLANPANFAAPAADNLELTPPGAAPAASTPGASPTPFIDCTTDLNLSQPRNGAIVNGAITFNGTADTPDFGLYRLQANGPQTSGQWASLLGRDIDQRVQNGFLGSVNLSDWQPGPYLIRLTAVNASGGDTGYCVIQITLDN